ncbi:MAG TPA: hypothetical protein VFW18_01910 [Gaiellales bacterium]|nr:hypothetical protein [Gaiellales bacterium]
MSGDEPAFDAAHVDDIPTLPTDGAPPWKPVRRHLGISSFGVNAFLAGEAGEHVIEEHTETGGGAAGHEELYVVLRGGARFEVDGSEIAAPQGTLVFVRDPESRRAAVSTEPDTIVLAFGGTPGEPYRPSPWEYYAPAFALSQSGDHEGALRLVADGLDQHPERPTLLYNLACYEALAGQREQAIVHLARAIELDPRMAEWARGDADFESVRDRSDFPA